MLLLVSFVSLACHKETDDLIGSVGDRMLTVEPGDLPPTVEGVLEKKYTGTAHHTAYFWEGEHS